MLIGGLSGGRGGDAKEGVFRFKFSRGWHLCGQCGALVDGLQGCYGYNVAVNFLSQVICIFLLF